MCRAGSAALPGAACSCPPEPLPAPPPEGALALRPTAAARRPPSRGERGSLSQDFPAGDWATLAGSRPPAPLTSPLPPTEGLRALRQDSGVPWGHLSCRPGLGRLDGTGKGYGVGLGGSAVRKGPLGVFRGWVAHLGPPGPCLGPASLGVREAGGGDRGGRESPALATPAQSRFDSLAEFPRAGAEPGHPGSSGKGKRAGGGGGGLGGAPGLPRLPRTLPPRRARAEAGPGDAAARWGTQGAGAELHSGPVSSAVPEAPGTDSSGRLHTNITPPHHHHVRHPTRRHTRRPSRHHPRTLSTAHATRTRPSLCRDTCGTQHTPRPLPTPRTRQAPSALSGSPHPHLQPPRTRSPRFTHPPAAHSHHTLSPHTRIPRARPPSAAARGEPAVSGGRAFPGPRKQAAPSPGPAKERPLVRRQRRAGRPNTAALSHLAALGRAARGSREPSVRRHPTSTPHTNKITAPNYTRASSHRLLQPWLPAYSLCLQLGPQASPPDPSFTPEPHLPSPRRSPPPRPWVPSIAPPCRHPLTLSTRLSPVSPISFVPQSFFFWSLSLLPPPPASASPASPGLHPVSTFFPSSPSSALSLLSPALLFPHSSVSLFYFSLQTLHLPSRPTLPQTPDFPSRKVL